MKKKKKKKNCKSVDVKKEFYQDNDILKLTMPVLTANAEKIPPTNVNMVQSMIFERLPNHMLVNMVLRDPMRPPIAYKPTVRPQT